MTVLAKQLLCPYRTAGYNERAVRLLGWFRLAESNGQGGLAIFLTFQDRETPDNRFSEARTRDALKIEKPLMFYKLGRFLQLLGLLILPIAMAGNMMDERLNLKQMLTLCGVGVAIAFGGFDLRSLEACLLG